MERQIPIHHSIMEDTKLLASYHPKLWGTCSPVPNGLTPVEVTTPYLLT